MEMFFIENKIYQNDCLYKLKENKEESGLVKSEVFYSMIKDKIYIKKYCLCNAIVNNVDTDNYLINCYLLLDDNNIKAVLKFNNIDTNIKYIKEYFYPQRIILCKIIDIKPRHNLYEIDISNKLDDLLSIKDFFKEQKNTHNLLLEEKYTSLDNNDFIIQGIKELKDIQDIEEKKKEDEKKLHYTLIDMENEQFFRNVNYKRLKKINVFDYKIRPSFRGENYLRLSFFLLMIFSFITLIFSSLFLDRICTIILGLIFIGLLIKTLYDHKKEKKNNENTELKDERTKILFEKDPDLIDEENNLFSFASIESVDDKKAYGLYASETNIGSDRFLSDIYIDAENISALQAKIIREDNYFYIMDCSDRNNTYLGNRKLEKDKLYEIKNGQGIRFGDKEYEFKIN